MKKILIVLVGGTICTEVKGNIRSINSNAGTELTKRFLDNYPEAFISDDLFVESPNFKVLSENMTVERWNELISYFCNIRREIHMYSGIIIAHGTDTLAFSSSLFSLLLKSFNLPVFIVSSNEPLTSNKSNGNENFKAAVECIINGINPGVYVIYKNLIDKQMYLHLGSRLLQCKNYDENFYSKGALNVNIITTSLINEINSKLPKQNDKYLDLLDRINEKKLTSCVLAVNPYVGLNYKSFNYELYKAVLHGTYHSGTSCVEKTSDSSSYSEYSILYFLDKCGQYNIPIYYSPSLLVGEIYDTVPIIANHASSNDFSVSFLYGMTNEMAYVKLLLGYSLDLNKEEMDEFLHTNIAEEFMD